MFFKSARTNTEQFQNFQLEQMTKLKMLSFCEKILFSASNFHMHIHISRVERKTSVSQMVVFPQT